MCMDAYPLPHIGTLGYQYPSIFQNMGVICSIGAPKFDASVYPFFFQTKPHDEIEVLTSSC